MSRDHNTPPAQCRWATFDVIGRLVRSLAPLAVGLSLPLSLPAVVYLTGLITQPNVTATAIAGQIGLVSHDSLVRMLGTLGWGLSCGACVVVRLVTAFSSEGWLIMDDVLLPKPFAKLIALRRLGSRSLVASPHFRAALGLHRPEQWHADHPVAVCLLAERPDPKTAAQAAAPRPSQSWSTPPPPETDAPPEGGALGLGHTLSH